MFQILASITIGVIALLKYGIYVPGLFLEALKNTILALLKREF